MPAISGKLEKMEGSPFFAQLHHREGQTLATVMDVKKDVDTGYKCGHFSTQEVQG